MTTSTPVKRYIPICVDAGDDFDVELHPYMENAPYSPEELAMMCVKYSDYQQLELALATATALLDKRMGELRKAQARVVDAVKQEREECAKVCETHPSKYQVGAEEAHKTVITCAAAIRCRNNDH